MLEIVIFLIMDKCRQTLFLHIKICVCLIFLLSSVATGCDKTQCPGPLQYYKDLDCKPIYKNPGDCCAEKYDCSHLKERSSKKCYINNNVYEIGEELKAEDADPCDIGCKCYEGFTGVATFTCAIVDCFTPKSKPGCYLQRSSDKCCPGEEVCPLLNERAKCVVDGKTYFDSEFFQPTSEPEKLCYCKPGYEGENVEPFCYTPKNICRPEFKHAFEIQEKCAPVYYFEQSPQTDCNVFSRCQNKNDALIPYSDNNEKSVTEIESATCTFGNMTMKIGDELNQATDYSSVCVKCKCEVPPTPTCQRLPDDECDVTVHPKFDNL